MAVRAGNPALPGGALCLDFINAVEPRGAGHPRESLFRSSNLVDWSPYTEFLTDEPARRLRQEAESRSEEAAAVSEGAVAPRETLYRIFSAVAREQPSPAKDLDRFKAMLPWSWPGCGSSLRAGALPGTGEMARERWARCSGLSYARRRICWPPGNWTA